MEGESRPAWRARRLAARLLSLLGWLIAVPIVIVTLVALALAGFYILALYLRSLDASGRQTGVTLAVVGVVAALGAVKAVQSYRNSGRALIATCAVALLGAAAVFGIVRAVRHDQPASVALGDALVATVAYPFRALWLTVFALAALVVGLLLVRTLLGWRQKASRGTWWRSSVTALLTTALGPFGIALLLGALVAAVGVAAKPLLDRAHLSAKETPWCLGDPQDWVPSSADCTIAKVGDGAQAATAWEWGSVLFGQALAPLIWATVALAVAVGGTALVVSGLWLFDLADEKLDGEPGDRGSRLLSRAYVAVEWGLGPLLVALIPVAAWFGAAQWVPWIPIPGGLRFGAQGTENLSIGIAVLGVAVAAMLLLAKALGISPSGVATGGKVNELIRTILDRPYDVATYLREPPRVPAAGSDSPRRALDRVLPTMKRARMPRERMVARFEALLDHLDHHEERGAPAPYDRLLILAHSQGTVLTVTMLHEPPKNLPPVVRLITFGSPLRQLYLQRLPRQFGWLERLESDPREYLPDCSNLVEWVSLATPKDFVGRTVHATVPQPWPDRIEGRRRIGKAKDPRDRDLALGEFTLPTGAHSTYWGHACLYKELVRMIEGHPPPERE